MKPRLKYLVSPQLSAHNKQVFLNGLCISVLYIFNFLTWLIITIISIYLYPTAVGIMVYKNNLKNINGVILSYISLQFTKHLKCVQNMIKMYSKISHVDIMKQIYNLDISTNTSSEFLPLLICDWSADFLPTWGSI